MSYSIMHRIVIVLLLMIMSATTIPAIAPSPAEAAGKPAHARIVAHPTSKPFYVAGAPNPHKARHRLDALWNPRHAIGAQINMRVDVLRNGKWVPYSDLEPFKDTDGNLAAWFDTDLLPGTNTYSVWWELDVIPQPGSGRTPYRRKNERGPAIRLNGAGSGPLVSIGQKLTTRGSVPNGCSQKVEEPQDHGNTASVVTRQGCEQFAGVRALGAKFVLSRCTLQFTGVPCVNWTKQGVKTVFTDGPNDYTIYMKHSWVLVPGTYEYRLEMIEPRYNMHRRPPFEGEIRIAPNARNSGVLRGGVITA